MDYQRCGLINPPTAQRIDCGYDSLRRKVETPYCPQAFPENPGYRLQYTRRGRLKIEPEAPS
jgi:hypothetical protein